MVLPPSAGGLAQFHGADFARNPLPEPFTPQIRPQTASIIHLLSCFEN